MIVIEDGGHHRGAHAPQLSIRFGSGDDLGVGIEEGVHQHILGRVAELPGPGVQGFDGHAAGDFSRRVAAHAVGNGGEQRISGIKASEHHILVVGTTSLFRKATVSHGSPSFSTVRKHRRYRRPSPFSRWRKHAPFPAIRQTPPHGLGSPPGATAPSRC